MKKILIISIPLLILLLLAGYFLLKPKPKVGDVITYQVINWVKPTTDAEWAEDVKAENFDIKSTGVLETMIQMHTDKLKKIEADDEVVNCPECVRYKYKKRFEGEGYKDPEFTKMVENAYQQDLAQHKWDIDKLNQSLERMKKEIELRDKGFVVVDTELKLGSVSPERIRYIND